jgi:hypothetical protein
MVCSGNAKDIFNLLPLFRETHITDSIARQIDILKKIKLKEIFDESMFLESMRVYYEKIDIHDHGDIERHAISLRMLSFASIETNKLRVISPKFDYLKTHIYWTIIDLVRDQVIDNATSVRYQDLFSLGDLQLYIY